MKLQLKTSLQSLKMKYSYSELKERLSIVPQKYEQYDVFFLDINQFQDNIGSLYYFLNCDEMERASCIHNEKNRCKYILRKALVRYILSLYVEMLPCEIDIQKEKYGKPFIGRNDIYFNLSHSYDKLAVVVSKTCPVGIDVQYMKEMEDLSWVKQDIFSEEEFELVNKAKDKKEKKTLFFDLWTRKEAFTKCVATGFTIDVKQIAISKDIAIYKSKRIKLISGMLNGDYVYSVANELDIRKE